MAAYINITGYIEDIYEGETINGKEYLGIKFYTQDAHDHDNGHHEIRWWFSSDAAQKISSEKIVRLLKMAEVPHKEGLEVKTVQAGLKLLSNEKLAALKIPVTVTENEYEGKIKAQYDLGWSGEENVKQSGFTKFSDLVAERLAEIKSKAPAAPKPTGGQQGQDTTPYDDDIPF